MVAKRSASVGAGRRSWYWSHGDRAQSELVFGFCLVLGAIIAGPSVYAPAITVRVKVAGASRRTVEQPGRFNLRVCRCMKPKIFIASCSLKHAEDGDSGRGDVCFAAGCVQLASNRRLDPFAAPHRASVASRAGWGRTQVTRPEQIRKWNAGRVGKARSRVSGHDVVPGTPGTG